MYRGCSKCGRPGSTVRRPTRDRGPPRATRCVAAMRPGVGAAPPPAKACTAASVSADAEIIASHSFVARHQQTLSHCVFIPSLHFLTHPSLAHRGFAAVCFAVRAGQFATSLRPGGAMRRYRQIDAPVYADRVASAIRPPGVPETRGPAATFRRSPRAA